MAARWPTSGGRSAGALPVRNASRKRAASRWARGEFLVAEREDASDVEAARQAGLESLLGKLQGFIEQAHGAFGDRDALGGGGGIGVGARGLCDDRDADGIGGGLRFVGIGARRLDRTADAAGEVELIGDAEPGIETPILCRRAGCALASRGPAVVCARVDRGLGQAVGAGFAQQRPGALVVGERDAQVGVGPERIADEAVEHRVLVEPPPIALHRVRGDGGRRTTDEALGLAGPPRRSRQCRIRSDSVRVAT